MDKAKICEILALLNDNIAKDQSDNILEVLSTNIKNIQQIAPGVHIELDPTKLPMDEVGNYLAWTFHLLDALKASLMASDDALNVLSVQQNKLVRDVLRESIVIGICFNLQPKLPQHKPPPASYTGQQRTLTTDYHRLCYSVTHLVDLLPCPILRPLVVFAGFQPLLNALYQIIYCPLKKPKPDTPNDITIDVYQTFLRDKKDFLNLLQKCEQILPKTIFIKETMLLLKTDCLWLKKAVAQNLTNILRQKGLKLIAIALLEDSRDYEQVDTTKVWKAIELLTKLVVSLRSASDFETNICGQLVELLQSKDFDINSMIFAGCVRLLYVEDATLSRQLLANVFEPLHRFLQGSERKFENNEDVTEIMARTIRLLKLVFDNQHDAQLPFVELTPYISVIFRVYFLVYGVNIDEVLEKLWEDIEDILINYLSMAHKNSRDEFFDCFIFSSTNTTNIHGIREDISFKLINHRIIVLENQQTCDISFKFNILLKLSQKIKNPSDLKLEIFLYLLNSLKNPKVPVLPQEEYISLHILITNLLTEMVEAPDMQLKIAENPLKIVEFIVDALGKVVQLKNYEEDQVGFRSMFLMLMILDVLVGSGRFKVATIATEGNAGLGERLLQIIEDIQADCVNTEVFALVKSVSDALTWDGSENRDNDAATPVANELDKVVADICDPLLPIRAHGLTQLVKLVEERHPDVLAKRMFVLNIFQQNIKNQDSFIYLAAINGLALMVEMCPDTVLETLTDEYTSTVVVRGAGAAADAFEVRMKLGEVLVKVSRNLGEKLSKYKSLLLNTFMLGTKDDDHLLRASSLSNLGEVCQILGNQLGTIINEVVECVHNVIMTDPAVEARRAAVAVLRQLFAGLRTDTLVCLERTRLTDVYRTLRRLYADDVDDVLRLQAQLAIEELAANMQELMLQHPQYKNIQELVQDFDKASLE